MRWKLLSAILPLCALALPVHAQSPIATLGGSCTTGYSSDQITAVERNIVVCNGSTWQNLLSAPSADPNYSLAIGPGVLTSDSATGGGSGLYNVGIGSLSLTANTTGNSNAALGYLALTANTTGSTNTAVGAQALKSNTTGYDNTSVGYQALQSNSTGTMNTATGWQALQSNTTGGANDSFGTNNMNFNTTGGGNDSFGFQGLTYNTTGNYNAAFGYQALHANTTGSYNVGIGARAGQNVLQTGSNNILIGANSAVDTPSSNTSNFLDIGNTIFATSTNTGTVSSPAGYVGIDTSTPAGILDVEGGAAPGTYSSGAGINLVAQSGGYNASSGGITLQTGACAGGCTTGSINMNIGGSTTYAIVDSAGFQAAGLVGTMSGTLTNGAIAPNYSSWLYHGPDANVPVGGIGFNGYLNGDNYVTLRSGYNGAEFISGDNSGNIYFYSVPSTGSGTQSIAGGSMTPYVSLYVSPAGKVAVGTTTTAGTGLTVAGAVYASAFQPSSDRRLKKNIATLSGSLEKLSELRGVSFDWRTPAERDIAKDMYFDTEHHQMGVVAEEVEQVYPDIVHTAPNGLKSVNYDALMGPMIEAIKTLDGRTDKLTIAVVILYAAAGFQFLRGRRGRAA